MVLEEHSFEGRFSSNTFSSSLFRILCVSSGFHDALFPELRMCALQVLADFEEQKRHEELLILETISKVTILFQMCQESFSVVGYIN